MGGSTFFGILTIFILFGLIVSLFVLVWIFGEDPAKRDEKENRYGPHR